MKDKLIVFALVLVLLLSCSGGMVAHAFTYDDSQNYLSLVEGYSTEEVYNFMREYLENLGYNLENYPYIHMIDNMQHNEDNNIFNPSYLLYLSTEPAEYFTTSEILRYGNSAKILLIYIYSSSGDGKICYDLKSGLWSPWYSATNTVYSNYEVYDNDNNLIMSKVSFPRPQMILGIQKPELTQAVTQENPLNQILILLPMVIVLLVGYVGLRKALATLRTTLKKA